MDFTKPVKAVALPQDVPSTSDRHLIEIENQVKRLMEAHLALTQPTQVNKITTLCEICSSPHDTQYCMDDFEQAYVDYASSRMNKIGGKRMPPKRTSTSEAPTMTQAAIKKLVAESVSAALEAQAANMANTDNNHQTQEAPIERKCSYKEFISCQPINFKGTEGAVGLIRWFERTKSVFSRSNFTEDCKVKFATCTLTEEALSW
ncbi:hypothetical protein Tco_1201175 [Tanacetum coccineum]